MTDNGGERRNSGAEDSWFKPSENRYLTQSEYEDPLEGEETEGTVFPDSGGYTGLSSSRPALVEPYPEALGGPPPSNGISYPGAGASAYQPLTRIPGESEDPEEPNLPSVAASARVPLPEDPAEGGRADSWPEGPQNQEFPAPGAWDHSRGADTAQTDFDEHDTDSGASAWDASVPLDQPWDGGTRAWDGDAPAVAPGDGAVGGRPRDGDAPDGSTPWNTAGGQPWDGDELGSPAWGAGDAPVGGADEPGADTWSSGTGVPVGQPWDADRGVEEDAPGPGPGGRDTAWDAPSSTHGAADPSGAGPTDDQPWSTAREQASPAWAGDTADELGPPAWDASANVDTTRGFGERGAEAPAGGQPWDGDELGSPTWSADNPAGGAGEPGGRSWDADDPLGDGGPRGRPWDADELGADSWGADASAAGTHGLDSWTPPRESDGWAGSGANESWTDRHGDELSPPAPGSGAGNTWVFGRDDSRLPDAVREAGQRRRESTAGQSGTSGWGEPDTGELSAAVPASDDPLAAIADMQTRARSRDEEPDDATRMFDAGDWEDHREPGYGRVREDGYDDGPDEYGYDAAPGEYGYDATPDGPAYEAVPDGPAYDDGPEEPGYDGGAEGTEEPEYDDGFTPADYGMSEVPAGRRRRRDPIAGDFPGFEDSPLGGDPGDPYPGYDNIDFLADTERGAVLTLWLGVASLLPGVGLAAALAALLVTGPKAKKQIRESRGQLDGLGLITAGTVFAVLGILVTVISVALWLIL
ncbi:hypothetical protein [Nocardiopsis quinghaiensis]|uniref:hypothetical protein n=1 Tax=Nocardiopsis quinghaiensis TaxID=464995 RepID=UPI001239553A|nr:hypothetical protein [Nocardiopsis quinghaiensis]